MKSDHLFLIELLLVLGIVLGLAGWELFALRRDQRRSAAASAERARHAEGEDGADQR